MNGAGSVFGFAGDVEHVRVHAGGHVVRVGRAVVELHGGRESGGGRAECFGGGRTGRNAAAGDGDGLIDDGERVELDGQGVREECAI